MKFNVQISEFERAVSLAGAATAAKGDRPTLACLKIEAKKGEVLVTGTNLEMMMTICIPVEGSVEKGECCIPAKLLQQTLTGLGAQSLFPTLDVSLEDGGLKIANSSGEFALLHVMATEEFPPEMAKRNTSSTFQVSTKDLVELFGSAVVATDAHGMPTHGAVNLTFTEGSSGGLRVAATDTRRMIVEDLHDVAFPVDLVGTHLVPQEAVHRVIAMAKGSESISIGKTSSMMVFTIDNAMLVTRLVDGKFPDVTRVLPKEYEAVALSARDLARAIEVVSPMASLASGMTRFRFNRSSVEVSATSFEAGTTRSTFNLSKPRDKSADDKTFDIAFNFKYLKDFLKINTKDQIEICLDSPSRPALFRPVESGFELRYVVMPMTVG